jgi:diadenosine tetraphosphate (Ap4A) HIT family hydrolase
VSCIFCEKKYNKENIILENLSWYAIYDQYPVTDKHVLLISKRHVETFFDLTKEEKRDVFDLIDLLKLKINNKTITGWNIGINCGESAGQTIMHCHIHLIPRRDGDIENPRGGVRGVIPDKRIY